MEVVYKVTGDMYPVNNVMVDYLAPGLLDVSIEQVPCLIGYSECNGSILPTYIFTENYVNDKGLFFPCKMIEL